MGRGGSRALRWIGLALCLAPLGIARAGVESYRQKVLETPGLLDYYALEADFADAVDGGNGSNHGWTQADGPPFETGVLDEGQSVSFNGIGQFLRIMRSIQDDFTIVAWMKTETPGIGDDSSTFYQGSGLIYADVAGVANDFGTAVTGSVFAFGIGNPDTTAHSTTPVTGGEWVQVAAVRQIDLEAGMAEFRIYIDGELEAEEIHFNAMPLDAAASITIGGNAVDGRYYRGLVDEVALYTEALDDDAVLGLHEAILGGVEAYREAAQALEGLIDYYDFEGRYDDSIEGENGLNNPDNLTSTSEPDFQPGVGDEREAAFFDGIDDVFTILRSVQDEFTILAWIWTDMPQVGTDTSTFYQGSGLIYADVGGVANDFGVAVTGTKLAFGAGNPDTTVHSATSVATGEWVHIAAVRDTLAGMIRVYVNGVLEGELAHGNAMPLDAALAITIGGNTVDGRYFLGAIDEVALLEVPLDEDTIAEIYDAYGGVEKNLFRRGDIDADGSITIGDPITLLNYLFAGGDVPVCLDAADIDDSGVLTIGDPVSLLNYQFGGGPEPEPPGPTTCGPDPTDGDPWPADACAYPQDLCP